MLSSRSYRLVAEQNDKPRRPVPPAPPPRPRAVLSARQLRRLPLDQIRAHADKGDIRCQLFLSVVGNCGRQGPPKEKGGP
jgi:hypothetical protein